MRALATLACLLCATAGETPPQVNTESALIAALGSGRLVHCLAEGGADLAEAANIVISLSTSWSWDQYIERAQTLYRMQGAGYWFLPDQHTTSPLVIAQIGELLAHAGLNSGKGPLAVAQMSAAAAVVELAQVRAAQLRDWGMRQKVFDLAIALESVVGNSGAGVSVGVSGAQMHGHKPRRPPRQHQVRCPSWEELGLPAPITVERRTNLSVAEFYHRYEVPRIPVIIADYQQRVTRRTWDLNYFVARCGGRGFAVKRRQSEAVIGTGVTETGDKLEWARLESAGEMLLGELLQLMAADPDSAAELYIHDESLCKRCPDVLADFIMPKYFANDLLQRIPRMFKTIYRDAWPSLFVGPEGSSSGLHVDSFGSHFFMYLMEGRKHWRLFRSTDHELFHPRGSAYDVDVMCPDVERFGSDLARSQPYDALMQPGDLLFVPSGSPHQVLNLDDTLAVSANYFDSSNLEAVLQDLTRNNDPNGLDEQRTKDLLRWIQSSTFDFERSMDFNITDKPFLDEFKDGYYNRLLGQHPHFSARGYALADGTLG